MDIRVICCGEDMTINQYEPDQDQVFVGFDCMECGSSFYGTYKQGDLAEEDESAQ